MENEKCLMIVIDGDKIDNKLNIQVGLQRGLLIYYLRRNFSFNSFIV